MIMRMWKGRVLTQKAAAYLEFLKKSGLRDYAATPGNLGVFAFTRTVDSYVEFNLVTLWESVEAIQRFAGEDYQKAHYYPEDKEFLLEFDPLVTHYEVPFVELKERVKAA